MQTALGILGVPMRRHVTYTNVAATLALVFAMSGSAIAAKHYLLSSTKQIKPSLLKQLRKPGPRGATGATGPAGAAGLSGPSGPSGASAGPVTELKPGAVLLTEPLVGATVTVSKESAEVFEVTNTGSDEIDVNGVVDIEGTVKAWQARIEPGKSANSPAIAAQTHYMDVVISRAGSSSATSPFAHVTCAIGEDGVFNAGCIAVH